jgi:hypothetical protein
MGTPAEKHRPQQSYHGAVTSAMGAGGEAKSRLRNIRGGDDMGWTKFVTRDGGGQTNLATTGSQDTDIP